MEPVDNAVNPETPEWPIELDTNGCGHIIVDQNREDGIFGQRILLTPRQMEQLIAYYKQVSKETCDCPDWEPCPCGSDSPAHCQWCCLDLTPEQIAAFNFETDEHIPPRPKDLPVQISCGACGITIDNPTEEQINFHFSEGHRGDDAKKKL